MNNNVSESSQKKTITWTAAQEQAMAASGRNVLVCAAAGSGKTATLTERIIRRLTDPTSPSDISRMVVVTYTKNAATELKEKIYRAISEKLKQEPDNRDLAIQLMKLPAARISTIHSFCYDIIKRNAAKLGMSSSVKIADAAECEIRSHRVMEQLVCDLYDREQKDGQYDFSMLAECLTSAKGEGTLSELFLALYKKLCSYPGGAKNLERVAGEYDAVIQNEFFDTKYGEVYRYYTEKKARGLEQKYTRLISRLQMENNDHPYLEALQSDLLCVRSVLSALPHGYQSTRNAVVSITRIVLNGLNSKLATETSDLVKPLREELKSIQEKLCTMYAYTSEQLDDAASKTATLSRTLACVMSEFERRFREDKREAGILDYNDLEYYANELLWQDGEKTEAALEIAALTDEIYIDEYQDVNRVQENIFLAVSNGKNLFMVGDVKQAIYAFRGGDPSLITQRRREHEKYEDNTESDRPCSVFMQNNFRSDSTVVNYVNDVCAWLLGHSGGKFEYTKEDELVYSKDGGKISDSECYPRFILCEKSSKEDRAEAEASFVAEEIVRLLCDGYNKDGTRIEPKDIAVIFRSDKKHAAKFKQELERRGVPAYSPAKSSPFDTPELQLVMCMLNSIDNPHRDIYLAGVLMSELYGVSAEELVRIRREFPEAVSLYEAVCSYTDRFAWEKGRFFIEQNDKYRNLSRSMPVDRLIWQIYLDTGLVRCAVNRYSSTYARREAKKNCMLIYDAARSFESGAFKGLYNFIEYIDGAVKRGAFDAGGIDTGTNAVRLMSMHASKGLEFPVCFVCGTGDAMNKTDSRQWLLFEPEIGIGFKLRGEDGFSVCDTPMRRAIALIKDEFTSEEEMRILYVALTRACEKLYVTAQADARSGAEKLLEKVGYKSELFASDTILSVGSFAEGILIAHARGEMNIPCERVVVSDNDTVSTFDYIESTGTTALSEDIGYEDTLDLLRKRLGYEYKHAALTRIRAKFSVSKLYPTVLDNTEADTDQLRPAQLDFSRKPHFLSEKKPVGGAERGSATHLIMQFADFQRMENEGVSAELDRLVREGFIDKSSAEIANIHDIERFLESGFYRRIKNADRLWREFRFNLQLDAEIFTEDEQLRKELEGEKLLVQGVIDGFFAEGEDIVLFDYKTDHLTEYELSHPDQARRKLTERHSQQLCYYRMALEQIFSRKIEQVYIYSLPLGEEICVDTSNLIHNSPNAELVI